MNTKGVVPLEVAPSRGGGEFRWGEQNDPLRRTVYLVRCCDIDLDDDRFQIRLDGRYEDLVESLKAQGLRVPVFLWMAPEERRRKPYVIICGFRRVRAALRLGWTKIPALFFDGSEKEAFAFAFIENYKRRTLKPIERAHAIWKLRERWSLDLSGTAVLLGLSERQIRRYSKLLSFPGDVLEALRDGRINMGHAALLSPLDEKRRTRLIARIERERLSREALKKELRRTRTLTRKCYFTKTDQGFRLQGVSVSSRTSAAEKERIRHALLQALSVLEDLSGRRDG